MLKCSALSSTSIIPARRVAARKYFAESLPKRVLTQARLHDQWQYGYLMMRCFVPEDFQRIIEDGERLTLVLDRETARIPREKQASGCVPTIAFSAPASSCHTSSGPCSAKPTAASLS